MTPIACSVNTTEENATNKVKETVDWCLHIAMNYVLWVKRHQKGRAWRGPSRSKLPSRMKKPWSQAVNPDPVQQMLTSPICTNREDWPCSAKFAEPLAVHSSQQCHHGKNTTQKAD